MTAAICGCESPRRHEPGCALELDPASRVLLSAELAANPLPAPQLSPDREFEALVRIHREPDFARRVLDWFLTRGVAA